MTHHFIRSLAASLFLAALVLPLPVAAQTTAPRFVYVGNSAITGGISAYTVDAITGALTPVPGSPFVPAGLDAPSIIANPNGRFVYASGYCDLATYPNCPTGTLSAFSVDAITGALTPVPGSPYSSGGNSTHSVSVDPAGHFVYVASECFSQTDCSSGAVAVFSVDATTGALTPVPGSPFASGGIEAFPLSPDPTGQFLFVANACVSYVNCTGEAVAVFSVNATTGILTQVPGSPFVSGGQRPKSISVDLAGHFVFVANRCVTFNDCSNGTVSVYSVDPTTHALTPAPGSPFGPIAGGVFSVIPNQNAGLAYVLEGGCNLTCADGAVLAFSVDASTGTLTPLAGFTAPAVEPGPSSMSLDSTGRYLYELSQCSTSVNCNNGGVTVFSVDPATGALTLVAGSPFLTGIFPTGVTVIDASSNQNATLSSLAVLPGAPSIPLGAAQQFTAVGTFSDGSTRFLTASATWSSSDNTIVTVSNTPGSSGVATPSTVGTVTITATVGTTSASTNLTVTSASPSLSAVNPLNGPQGHVVTPVTLTGANLLGATINPINGITISGVVASATQISATFTIAANAPTGPQSITVTVGGVISNALTFTIFVPPPPPTLASLSSTDAPPGVTGGIVLTGTNFITPATISASGTGIIFSNVTVQSATSIVADFAIAQNAPPGPQNVSVITAGGTSNTLVFTVDPPAGTLTSLSPSFGVQGTSVNVTFSGVNFYSPAIIYFGCCGSGLTATNTTVVNSTTITSTIHIAANATLGAQNLAVITNSGVSNYASFTVNLGPLALNSISPTSTVQGAIIGVSLTGTGFASGATVNLSGTGVTASGVTVVDSTIISATLTIATGAPLGTRSISVTTTAGTSGTVPFTVNATPGAPTLSAPPTPQNLVQGNSYLVTLTGTNFVPGSTTINLSYTGVSVSNISVPSSTSMSATFTIAANAPVGSAAFTVSSPFGSSGTRAIDISGVPVLTSISPANANPGTSLTVTLSGSQFLLAQIQFSATGITATNRKANSPLFTALTYTFTIAANALPGPQTLTLTNAAGTSNGVTFTINGTTPPPTLTSLSNTDAPPGIHGGIFLTGTNFLAPATISASGTGLTFSNVMVQSTTSIVAEFDVSPNAPSGPQNVSVTTPGGTSNTLVFTVDPFVATISSVSPSSGVQGSSVNVILSGANFYSPVTLFFNTSGSGLTATKTTVVNSSTITSTIQIAANATLGAQSMVVITHSGQSNWVPFTVNLGPPTLSGISPTSGNQGQTITTVTLTGSNLSGASINALSGITVSNVVATASQVTATFTIGASTPVGPQSVTVTTPGGTSNGETFTVNAAPPPAPTLTSISPTSGNQGQTITTVTLMGTNLGSATINALSGITVSNVVATVSQVSATFTIGASTPVGPHSVTVTTAGGTSNAVTFTVNFSAVAPPTLTAPPSPQTLVQGNAYLVTLTGTSFVAGNTAINLNYSGVSVSNITVLSSTSLTATFTIAANAAVGTAAFTVSTPSGTSGTRAIDVIGVPVLNTTSPASGSRGTALTVTLSGSKFMLAQIQFSGTGITASNRVISSGFTTLTYTFTIAANAPTGPQSISLTNPAGTSAPVTFTVQ